VAAVRDLATAIPIVIVPVPAEVVARIGDPAYQTASVPANTYNGQGTEVATVAIQNFLVTHEGVPAETVYTMTRAMFDNLEQMTAAHAAAKSIRKENAARGMPLPLHPGAEKYYREAGLLK
ncbi:MAG: TAXI family TRAP transporter solute-binding subunit, partial [Proteobacteria bacterium]|nr:TAXI family TRAP transporter solute-binding subunit [Pseudomonadota bacterium]